jgi:predicted PurR-regulated permease PerM
MPKNKLESISFLVLFAVVSLLLFFVLTPFFTIIALAAVFAVLLHRPYERLTRVFGKMYGLTAVLVVVLTLIFFIVPLFFLGGQILQEAQSVFLSIYGNSSHYLQVIQQTVENPIRQISSGFVFDINAYVENILAVISNHLGSLAYQTLAIFFQTFLMLLALFFFLRDGKKLVSTLIQLSPLGEETTREILNKMSVTINAVINGTLVNALIRWVCFSVAFYIFGIPNFILWGSLGGIIGAIPGLGTIFAFIPAIAYSYLQGNILGTVGLTLSAFVIVIVVDNILAAYFFGKGLDVSPIFVLFSILGGVVFFGPLGFVLGPLVLSVFLSVARVYDLAERGKIQEE